MTEAQWLACDDPAPMLAFLRRKVSDRKLRLFACACARAAWHLLSDGRSREAVEIVERCADRQARGRELGRAERLANEAQFDVWVADQDRPGAPWPSPVWSAAHFAYWAAVGVKDLAAYYLNNREGLQGAPPAGVQAGLLRDVAGDPFRTTAADVGWLTPTVSALATAVYEECALPSGELDAARLAVLADALEDAGCADEAIFGHLRAPGPHVRGCWVVDLILGKE